MNENEIIDVNDEDVCIEDIVDGSGHPVLTVVASLLGGAAIGAGSKFLYDRFNNKDKKLERKQKKLNKLKRDAEKLGIDLSDIPEIQIPEDEEIEEIKLETDEKVEEKPKKGGKKNK